MSVNANHDAQCTPPTSNTASRVGALNTRSAQASNCSGVAACKRTSTSAGTTPNRCWICNFSSLTWPLPTPFSILFSIPRSIPLF